MRTSDLTHAEARALCDAGYMPLATYLRLCDRNGWPKDR